MPFKITPYNITKCFPWWCKPKKWSFWSTEKKKKLFKNKIKKTIKINFGSSSGCGGSRAFPTGFCSASSAVTSASSASIFPFFKIKIKSFSQNHFVFLLLIKFDHEFLLLLMEQSLATNLNSFIYRIYIPSRRLRSLDPAGKHRK